VGRPKPAANEPYPPGTEVWVPRTGGYHHAAVYIGNQEVVHVFAEPMGAAKALLEGKPIVNVLRSPLSTFLDGASISSTKKGPSVEKFSHDQIVQRALSHVGQAWSYNPLTHNCQHFTSSVVDGVAVSPEAQAIEDAFKKLPGKIEHEVAQGASHLASSIASGAQSAGHAAEHAAESVAHKLKFW
jgi:hypothetical protein